MSNQTSLQEYDSQLARVSGAIIEMSKLVKQQLALAKDSVQGENTDECLQQIREIDYQVNALDEEIEQVAMKVLSLRQPMGVDLRSVSSSLKLSGYIENMGDLVKKIAAKTTVSEVVLSSNILKDLLDVSDIITEILDAAMIAFEQRDTGAAVAVWKRDDEVDAIYHDLYRRILEAMQSQPESIPDYMYIMMAAKNYERIGDYLSRYAKVVYYIGSGERFNKSDH